MRASHQKMQMQESNQTDHTPVLLQEVLQYLAPKAGESYLDLTAGYGGHAQEIISITNGPAVLVDRDKNAISYLSEQFKQSNVEIVHQDFQTESVNLSKEGRKFDLILADLGVSSPHLNTASRGFSIRSDGPLDMRMDQSQELSAETIVNNYSEEKLTDIIRYFGEEPHAKKIAKSIVTSRPIRTTGELAEAIIRVVRRGKSKVHPATKTFQALRIAVNNELEQLTNALPVLLDMLEDNGRIAVISFHSLEDRIVKKTFADRGGQTYDATLKILTKNPVTANQNEIVLNPRARSAKLRAAVKIKI